MECMQNKKMTKVLDIAAYILSKRESKLIVLKYIIIRKKPIGLVCVLK
jgi:hypothetical protein